MQSRAVASVHTLGCDATAPGCIPCCVLAPQAEQPGVRQADERGFAMGRFAAWSVRGVPACVGHTQHREWKSLLSTIGITGLGTLKQPGCSWGSSETSSMAAAGSGLCSAAGFGSSGSRSLTNHANSSAKTLTQQAQGLVTCVTCVPRPRVPHSSQTPSTQLHQPHAALGAASPTRPWAQAGAVILWWMCDEQQLCYSSVRALEVLLSFSHILPEPLLLISSEKNAAGWHRLGPQASCFQVVCFQQAEHVPW